MSITLRTPESGRLDDALDALREWQHDEAPMQLHPGDVGWFWRHGADATASAVRTWSRGDEILAVGLLDGPRLLRLTMAPHAHHDDELARRLVDDLADSGPGSSVRAAPRSRHRPARSCASSSPRRAGTSTSRGPRCSAT